MFVFKLTLAAASIQSVLSCPAAKKTNLRFEEVQDYHRKLSQIIDVESQRLAITSSPIYQPICNNPAYVAGSLGSRGTPGTPAADANIQAVYQGVRTFFYKLVDSIQNDKAQPLEALTLSQDPMSLFNPTTATAPAGLDFLKKAYRISNLLGNALRLVFHDAGEVDIRTADLFGSDGCLADNGPNSGLKEKNTIAVVLIEPLWQQYCDKISRADFWVLFGKIAAESSLPNGKFSMFMAAALAGVAAIAPLNPSPYMPYLNLPFQYGRKDAIGNCNLGSFRADGKTPRLPGHQPGLSEFTEVYVKQMGLDVRTGLILSGAHSVGHVHTQFSGFGFNDDLPLLEAAPTTNAWDETPWSFDNIYFDSLAGEFWLNNDKSKNVIQNLGGTPAKTRVNTPSNNGASFWAVQIAPGVLQPVPACINTATCGLAVIDQIAPPLANGLALIAAGGVEVLFCVDSKGKTQYSTSSIQADPANSWASLAPFTNPTDLANTCNCAQFFAIPALIDQAVLNARGCATLPHPKTIMLNADMVQAFPISGKPSTKVILNLESSGPGAIANLGKGDIGELCGPRVVNGLASAQNGILNSNEAPTLNKHLAFPSPVIAGTNRLQGFGCVKNSKGNAANFIGVANQQIARSSLLPKDPNNVSVSLWATIQSFMSLGVAGSCINGVSIYNNPLDGIRNPYTSNKKTTAPAIPVVLDYTTYSGSIVLPIDPVTRFIGENTLNGLLPTDVCTEATPPNGEGRDNFYREFEVAWVKMTTVAYDYTHTFNVERIINGQVYQVSVPFTAPGNKKLGKLFDIILKNPRQLAADVASGTIKPTGNPLKLPLGITWNTVMTGGPLFGSSTCYYSEINC